MATECFSLAQGLMARITKVDECGKEIFGPCSQVVFKAASEMTLSPQVNDGDAKIIRDFTGDICYNVPACPTLESVDVEMTFCNLDPDLISMITSSPLYTNAQGDHTGFDLLETLSCDTGVRLDIWTHAPSKAGCGAKKGGTRTIGLITIPWLTVGTLGDISFNADDPTTISIKAKSRSGSQMGRGAHNVELDADGNPGPFVHPISDKAHMRIITTNVEPPEAKCGCQPLSNPDGPETEVVKDDTDTSGKTIKVTVTGDAPDGGKWMVDPGDGSKPVQWTPDYTHAFDKDGKCSKSSPCEFHVQVYSDKDSQLVTIKTVTIPQP